MLAVPSYHDGAVLDPGSRRRQSHADVVACWCQLTTAGATAVKEFSLVQRIQSSALSATRLSGRYVHRLFDCVTAAQLYYLLSI